MNALICQINAIAKLCVTYTGGEEWRISELLSIRRALAEALATLDDHIRWRRQLQTERPGSHSEETA